MRYNALQQITQTMEITPMSLSCAVGSRYYDIDNGANIFKTKALCKAQSHARWARLQSSKSFSEGPSTVSFSVSSALSVY
jgi:hypothetical protein